MSILLAFISGALGALAVLKIQAVVKRRRRPWGPHAGEHQPRRRAGEITPSVPLADGRELVEVTPEGNPCR